MHASTLVLRRSDVDRLLTLETCITAVENAFRKLGQKQIPAPGILGIRSNDGGFHVKAGLLDDGKRSYFAAKCNANFSNNMSRFGLPAIQGLIFLCDGNSGYPLAVMDSIQITLLRTGAATAVAAKYLARTDSKVATICGCGSQGAIQLRALSRMLAIEHVYAFDRDSRAAARFAASLGSALNISIEIALDLRDAVRSSDVCITCTPARHAFLYREDVEPGIFIAAVGADSPEKQELDPLLLKDAKVIVDTLEQCATIGELHHAIEAKILTTSDVHAELADIVTGLRPGRTTREEVTIFDCTGTAIQDVAAAIAVFNSISDKDEYTRINFNDIFSS
jgi:alanine dehydrogenase